MSTIFVCVFFILSVSFTGLVLSRLYGFTLLQAVAYFRRYPRDKWILKVTVSYTLHNYSPISLNFYLRSSRSCGHISVQSCQLNLIHVGQLAGDSQLVAVLGNTVSLWDPKQRESCRTYEVDLVSLMGCARVS